MRTAKIALALGLGSLAGIGGGVGAHFLMPRSPIVEGLTIGDRRVPDAGSIEAWLDAQRPRIERRVARFTHKDQVFEATLGELGVSIDVSATLANARTVGHTGSLKRRLREAREAKRGGVDVPLVLSFNRDKAAAVIAAWAPHVAESPEDARLDLTNHKKIPDVVGRALDVDLTVQSFAQAAHEDEETLPILTRPVFAKVTLADLARVDVEHVVSAFETTFSTFGVGAARAINIKSAVTRIEGTMLAPGELFSFNDKVGPRTRERGFVLAPEIQGDDMQMGYGGGTCQASSTLFAAALFGALEIVERLPHSRPSSYTKMGLDATVSYPLADLKIRNALSFPVIVHAFFPKPNTVRVEILGGEPVAKVDYTYGVGATEDFMRRIVVKPGMEPGRRILHQKGIRGFDVTSLVKVNYASGRVEERRYFSGYRPVPEIYWIAPGYNTADLPPLPEHAKGVEDAVSLGSFGPSG